MKAIENKRFHLDKILAALCVGTLVSTSALADKDVDIDMRYGNDSNPHKLADTLSPKSESYVATNVAYSANNKEIYFKAELDSESYSDSTADVTTIDLSVGYESDFKLKGTPYKYDVSLDYKIRDKTFVSNSTGQEASSGGQLIGDRFDSDTLDFNAEATYVAKSNLIYDLSYQFRSKSYEDFSALGLTNLDYSQHEIGLDMEYPTSDQVKFLTAIHYRMREYDNREAKDLTGAFIANTNLEYDYVDFEFGFLSKVGKTRWKTTIGQTNRSDNELGYYDSSSLNFDISVRHKFGKKHTFRADFKYKDYEYDNRVDINQVTLNEETKARDGWSLDLDYQFPVTKWSKRTVYMYVELTTDDYDSTNPIFAYSKNNIGVGFRWAPM
ncbi:MAG: hypothetical protein OEY96_03590 [Gammaproteobacteria bacterium]|nr:hypothetical protein [Gammaproteobacteria bacterium]